ncbi:MAG: response regulator [Candidatus Aminicenantes bacterium]|nr:response regulator [Candidatus Aminicenantes bacterium]NLH76756.1 response regulator [Acidobacteriota bacterium]
MDGERREAARRASPRVLLVDDDATTRNLVAHFLRKEGFVVVMARDGADALAQARGGRPDLVVVDAAVPGMDGFELLARLKQDPGTAALPVLMLSSLDDEEAIVRSLEAGAEYVVKPFSPRILVAKVKKILREAHGHAVDRRPL